MEERYWYQTDVNSTCFYFGECVGILKLINSIFTVSYITLTCIADGLHFINIIFINDCIKANVEFIEQGDHLKGCTGATESRKPHYVWEEDGAFTVLNSLDSLSLPEVISNLPGQHTCRTNKFKSKAHKGICIRMFFLKYYFTLKWYYSVPRGVGALQIHCTVVWDWDCRKNHTDPMIEHFLLESKHIL